MSFMVICRSWTVDGHSGSHMHLGQVNRATFKSQRRTLHVKLMAEGSPEPG